MNRSDDINELVTALAKAQAEMGSAAKDNIAHVRSEKGNYTYKYATLANVIDAARPCLTKHGLAVVQPFWSAEGRYFLTTILMHTSGQWIASEVPVEPLARTPQAIGSALTYMRRYALSALVCLAADDDDGEAASKEPPKQTEQPRREEAPSRAPAGVDPAFVAMAQEFGRRAVEAPTRAEIAKVAAEVKASTLPDALKDEVIARIKTVYNMKPADPPAQSPAPAPQGAPAQ